MPENPKRIKLLIFIHDLAPFGAQRVALNILKYLDKDAFRVTVCSFGRENSLAPDLAACGAEVVSLEAGRYLSPRAWLRFIRLLLALRPDIVQTSLPELSVPLRLFCALMPGTRVLHTVQNPFYSEPWYWRYLNLLTLPLCARVVFCSQSLRDASGAGVPARQAVVVRNGITLPPGEPRPGLRTALGIAAGEKVVCCVARLTGQKGQDLLVRALAYLAGRKLSPWLLLAGDGEDEEKLRALARELKVSGRVCFLGRRADVGAVLAASDIYAAPSRWEGLDIALGEAMLAGLPCVATGIEGHWDLLRDGVTGLAVPPEDPAALAAALARLLEARQQGESLAAAGRELVRQDFSVEVMAKKYEKIYFELKA